MADLPLTGIRVLEFSAYISGPYTGAILASMGAEVIKIEPVEGDAFRIGLGTGSPYFAQYNAGKKSVVVNLKQRDGVAAVMRMLPAMDVVIENMRPGKMAALGLGAEHCRAINPALVYASISGFGNGGPWRDRPAYDSIGQALGGIYTVMNDADDVRLTGTCIADLITAIGTTLGILSGLVGRGGAGTGRGVHIETSVFEAVSMLTIDALTQALDTGRNPVRETRHPQAQNFCLPTASDDYIVLHLSSSQKFWRSLTSVIERADLIEDDRFRLYADRVKPGNFAALKALLEEEFSKRPRADWEQRLIAADVPFAPALTMQEVVDHEQTQWLGILGSEAAGHRLVNPPWRFDGIRLERSDYIPPLGADTRAVLSRFVPREQLEALMASGTVGGKLATD